MSIVIGIGIIWVKDWNFCSLYKTEDLSWAKSYDRSSEIGIWTESLVRDSLVTWSSEPYYGTKTDLAFHDCFRSYLNPKPYF